MWAIRWQLRSISGSAAIRRSNSSSATFGPFRYERLPKACSRQEKLPLQSASFVPSGVNFAAVDTIEEFVTPLAALETNVATSAICLSVSWSRKEGIPEPPVRTCFATAA